MSKGATAPTPDGSVSFEGSAAAAVGPLPARGILRGVAALLESDGFGHAAYEGRLQPRNAVA